MRPDQGPSGTGAKAGPGRAGDGGARTVLVTGSSRGLGRAIALAFGALGHRVAVHYVKSAEPAEEVAQLIRYAGG